MKEDVIIAKLIKMYVLHHPKCTARDISDYIDKHNFGIRRSPNAREISGIINNYNNIRDSSWFNIEIANKYRNGVKKYIIRDDDYVRW